MPIYYSGKNVMVYTLERADVPTLGYTSNRSPYLKYINSLEFFTTNPEAIQPQYVIFTEGTDLENRIAHFKKYYPDIQFIKKAMPSNVDQIMKALNPNNKNEVFHVYRINSDSVKLN